MYEISKYINKYVLLFYLILNSYRQNKYNNIPQLILRENKYSRLRIVGKITFSIVLQSIN